MAQKERLGEAPYSLSSAREYAHSPSKSEKKRILKSQLEKREKEYKKKRCETALKQKQLKTNMQTLEYRYSDDLKTFR